MELRVNDYVRTKRGEIHKITDLKPHYENGELILEKQLVYIDNKYSGWNYEQFNEFIIKSSPNIIDILEVGDYVNGYLVIEKDINNELRYIDLKDRNMKYVKYLDVKSIVTKEMFSSIEYEVKQ